MQTFKDNQGKPWTLDLTNRKSRDIAQLLGLDVLNPQHYLQLLASLTDRLTYVFCLVEPEAKKHNIDADAFESRLYQNGSQFDGAADRASLAFLRETEVFFRKLGQTALATLAEKSIASMEAGQTRLNELLDTGQLATALDNAEGELSDLIDQYFPPLGTDPTTDNESPTSDGTGSSS